MLAIVVTVSADEVEIASDTLWALGVVAIEERQTKAHHGGGGAMVELWTSLGDDATALTDDLAVLRYAWRFEDVDATISETWRAFAVPTWVAPDLVIYPAWQDRAIVDGEIAIPIDPGATFGMGDHPTTALSVLAMREVLSVGDSVLDVGCGSGVLAIAACRLGARSAEAIDISPAAVPTTAANAVRNGVADRIHVSTTPLASIDDAYDVVLANILAPTLIELAADLRRVTTPGGALVVSGILAERYEHVLSALRPLRQTARIDQDGWTAITLRG